MSAWNAPAPPSYNAPSTTYMNTFTPYLQLKHLLSLTWLAYPVLSLLIVAFRLQLSLATSQDAVTSAKNDLLASCKAAETAATSAASMPRYLAIASNQQFADAVNGSLNAARAALILALTVMEAIINFIIDLYRSTFLCFLELVVRGGLAILISAVQEINSLVQSAAASLRTSIQSDISSANGAITTAINAINKINPFSNIQAPQISVPSLDALQNLTLPDSFTQALTNLNNSIPSVADLKDALESIIDTPFELVKKDINDTFSQFSFNSSVLPIPDQNRLSFCNQLDTSLVDDVGRDLIKTTKIGILIMILLALLLIGLNCLLTWYKWRCMNAHFEYTRQAWSTDPTITHTVTLGAPQVTLSDHNLMLLQSNSAHPLITRIVNQIAARFRLTPSQYTNLQWFLSYIFHAPAIACFLIGFFGLLSIQIQLLAMGPLVARYQDRAQAASSDFSNSIAASINSSMYNQSAAYASNINGQVDAVQTQINNGVFGWIENTTQTLNNTVNAFYDDVQNAVATVFNGSILEEPANEFIKCFIGSKVDAIESALTFLHNNLQIDIPRVNDSVLVLSPASVNEATAPIAAAALGDGSDGNQGILLRLVNGYAESLKRERVLFALFLALWGFVVLMAICILLFHSFKERKRIRYLNESRTRFDEIVVPYKLGMQNSEEKGQTGNRNLPAFTPLPSPKFNAFKPFSFSRSPSPASTSTNDPSQSKESLAPKPESSWASLFTRNPNAEGKGPSPLAKGSTRLFAIGRKAVGKDRVKTAVEEQNYQDASPVVEPQQNENRNTAWFKRMTNVIAKKDSVPDFWENNAGRGRPNLQISIEPPSRDSIDADDSVAVDNRNDHDDPKSRWSASPDPTQNTSPWTNMITPVKKPFSPPRQPISLPMRPKPRHNASVPTSVSIDVDPISDLMAPMQPTPFARPLHHGFDSSQHAPYRPPPPPPSHPRPPRPPRRASLAPPPDRHRRSSSVPEWTMPQTLQVPVSRFLTGQTSPINPFVTPFDDERHVTIDPPAHARKSMRTNPFAPVAL